MKKSGPDRKYTQEFRLAAVKQVIDGGRRILFAARPELLTPVLRIVHRVIAGFLLRQAGLKRASADTGAVTLIQRFGSAANLNIHLHCLVLDGVYRRTGCKIPQLRPVWPSSW